MRRALALISVLLMLASFTACAPDNIVAPPVQPGAPDDSQSPGGAQGDTDKPASAPAQSTGAQSDENLTDGARYLKNKTRNDHIRPAIDIDGKDTVAFKTPQLSGVELSFFTPEDSAFSAGSMDEKAWFDALEKEYGLKLKYTVRPDNTLYSSQLIAMNSGRTVDIISARVNDCAAAMSLMQSAKELITLSDGAPLSARVFGLTGGKLFTAKGDCRVLWYNKSMTGETDPFELYGKNEWNTEKLSKLSGSIGTDGKRFIECSDWLAFGSAGALQASGITSDIGYTMSLIDEAVIDTFEAFGSVFNRENVTAKDDFNFKAGNTAFLFGANPTKGDFSVGWAPIPAFSESGKCIGELCGSAMGLSRTVSDARKGAAAAFMTLWCARYSESRADELIYDIGLTPTEADSYLTFCEVAGGLFSADAKISELFHAQEMPVQLYGDPDTVYNTYGAAYARTDVINDRYQ